MAKFIGGTEMLIGWRDNSGTIWINAQYQTFDTNWSGGVVDVTSGSQLAKEKLPTIKDFVANYVGFHDGTASPLGTADLARMEPRMGGTLYWAPQGTTAGRMKGAIFAWIAKQDLKYPYDNAVTVTLDFEGSGELISDPNTATW
jgi:hypothetical protein